MPTFATKIKCPYCSFNRFWHLRRNKFKCKNCRREWSSNRTLAGIRLSDTTWQKCISLFLTQRAIRTVAREANIGHTQAEKITHLVRILMAADTPPLFSGVSEADETFIGGQWKNKRRSIRRLGTKKGHGTTKIPITGVLNRPTGMVQAKVLWKRTGETYWRFIVSCLTKDSILYTDGYKMNRGIKNYNIAHDYVDHHRGEYVRGDVHTNGIEGFWGYLKRHMALVGGIRRDRLPLFVAEFVWRYNNRKLTHEEQCQKILKLLKNYH